MRTTQRYSSDYRAFLCVATSPESHERARIAEALGYRRAFFFDSPALYSDVCVNSRLICATFSLRECAIDRGTVSTRVDLPRGGKEGAYSHGTKHDQVPEAAGAVRHPHRLARRATRWHGCSRSRPTHP